MTLIASLSRHKTLLKEVKNYQKAQFTAQRVHIWRGLKKFKSWTCATANYAILVSIVQAVCALSESF